MKLYIKKEEDGKVIFEEVKTICGRSINEVMGILEGLNMEEEYDMKLTIKNLIKYKKLIDEETNNQIKRAMDKALERIFNDED